MKVYAFKVQLQRDESIWRIVELHDDHTLDDLHQVIQKAFDWDDDHTYAFYMSGEAWDPRTEYVAPHHDASLDQMWSGRRAERADKTAASTLGLSPGDKFLYIFDFGDEWRHDIELLEVREAAPGETYPRIAEKHGENPEQYPDWEKNTLSVGEAKKALGPVAELLPKIQEVFEESHEDIDNAAIMRHFELAMELHAAIRKRDAGGGIAAQVGVKLLKPIKRILKLGKSAESKSEDEPESFDLFCIAAGNCDILGWLISLPDVLAAKGQTDKAASLARSWAEIVEARNFLGDLTVIFAEAGREDKAWEQIRANDERFPNDLWVQIKAGHALWVLKDLASAETRLRRCLEMATNNYNRSGVLERLIPVLREAGKTQDADTLEAGERQREQERMAPVLPHKRKEPKVGRNDPCPCGSGKKHKKCCLGNRALGFPGPDRGSC